MFICSRYLTEKFKLAFPGFKGNVFLNMYLKEECPRIDIVKEGLFIRKLKNIFKCLIMGFIGAT